MNLNVFLNIGDDQMTLNHVIAKVATLNGGDGNDTLNVTDLVCTQCFINGGNGNDQLNLTSIDVTVKGFNVDAGAGNDNVALERHQCRETECHAKLRSGFNLGPKCDDRRRGEFLWRSRKRYV